jgi:hypothetical protein
VWVQFQNANVDSIRIEKSDFKGVAHSLVRWKVLGAVRTEPLQKRRLSMLMKRREKCCTAELQLILEGARSFISRTNWRSVHELQGIMITY